MESKFSDETSGFVHAWDESESVHFAHVRRHFRFALPICLLSRFCYLLMRLLDCRFVANKVGPNQTPRAACRARASDLGLCRLPICLLYSDRQATTNSVDQIK